MSGRRLLLAFAALPALALVPLAGPASAETLTVVDAGHDVVSLSTTGEGSLRPETSRREGDALRMRVTHGTRNVRVLLRLSKLSRSTRTQTVHTVAFRTNEGRRVELSLYVHGRRWQGQRSGRPPVVTAVVVGCALRSTTRAKPCLRWSRDSACRTRAG